MTDAATTMQRLIDTHGRDQVQALIDGTSVIVPREPTRDMKFAGLMAVVSKAIEERPDNWKQHRKQVTPEFYMQMGREITNSQDAAALPYEAMLAARPGAEHE